MIDRSCRGALTLIAIVGAGCTGSIDDPPGAGPATDPASQMPGPTPGSSSGVGRELAPAGGLRRLTVDEYDNTIRDLLGEPKGSSQQALPHDSNKLFDNDVTAQAESPALVGAVEILGADAVTRLIAQPDRLKKLTLRLIGRTPAGPDDQALRDFIKGFGRQALRRPLLDEDMQTFIKLATLARADNDFNSGALAVVQAMLQHPELLYHVELGEPVSGVPGLFKLTDWEMAARLSYFLWGTTPGEDLLSLAESRRLHTPADVRAAAAMMLTRGPLTPGAKAPTLERMARFHAMWMKYDGMSVGSLTPAMQGETTALIERMLRQKLPWQDLLRSKDTKVNYDLAKHYGLKLPANTRLKPITQVAEWVPYAGTKRRGLLSHATFLQMGVKTGAASIIYRGKDIRERLFCQTLVPKPKSAKPLVIESPCVRDQALTRTGMNGVGGCGQSCHGLMDTIGLGLENYDAIGRYMPTQSWQKDPRGIWQQVAPGTKGDRVDCRITGEGDLDGQIFNGPSGLADRMLAHPLLNGCIGTPPHRSP